MSGGPVLVTGASGFAGRHLVEHLRQSADVVGWSRSPASSEGPSGVRWQQIDLTHRDQVCQSLRDLQPREVYHLAGEAQVDRSDGRPAQTLEVNVVATHHLLDGLRRLGSRARVLVTSSATVYAPSTTPIPENGPTSPRGAYAFSKLAQEMLSVRAVAEDGIDVVITRSFNHTGARQSPSFAASSFARQVALIERDRQSPVLSVGNLDSVRDLTDVRDVVRAYVALMAAGIPGEVYNVASGVGRPIRAVVDVLLEAARVPLHVEVDPTRVRPAETTALVGDISKLQALTGWTPQISFEQMLTDLLDYWRAQP